MSSPFPGMDPYLEGEMWQEFHERLANEISAQLMTKLPLRYVALLAKRYVIASPQLGIAASPGKVVYPDVHVAQPPRGRLGEAAVAYGDASVIELVSPADEYIPIPSIEVRDVADRRLVTAIEILSPVNKQGSGWREYTEKRRAILNTRTHLLELDLLRGGERIELIGDWTPAPYYIFLSRWQRRPITETYPITLRQPLPSVPVPLLPPDADVMLDVQAAVDACFKLVRYERLLNYGEPPPQPEFTADDLAWIRQLF